ncbi:hypothetical protein DER45DRAFT_121587 [Fusarium avenaceum]|nr:hypothetical protein DER45DRAFT_121587 [Fusarium avenaceum]
MSFALFHLLFAFPAGVAGLRDPLAILHHDLGSCHYGYNMYSNCLSPNIFGHLSIRGGGGSPRSGDSSVSKYTGRLRQSQPKANDPIFMSVVVLCRSKKSPVSCS